MSDSKEYIRGSKKSNEKKNVLFKIFSKQIDFMTIYINYKREQGYHKLAYTRTDIMDEALSDFIQKKEKDFIQNASPGLIKKAEKLQIFNSKKSNDEI